MSVIRSFDYPVAKSMAKHRRIRQPSKIVLAPNKKYILVINYPLNKEYRAVVSSGRGGMTLKRLLDTIVAHYYKIYKSPRKYEIWGHGITDLAIEAMSISPKGVITLQVGS